MEKLSNLKDTDSRKSVNIQFFAEKRNGTSDEENSSEKSYSNRSNRSKNSRRPKNNDKIKPKSNNRNNNKNTISRSGITVSGVNASLRTVGSSNDEVAAVNSFARFPIAVLFDESQSVYVEKSFDDVLQKLSVRAGYITNTTFDQILSVLHCSARVYAHLLTLFRAANCVNLKNQKGQSLHLFLNAYNRNADFLDPRDYYAAVANGDQLTNSAWNLFTPISNAVWEQKYLSVLDRIYLPAGVKSILDYFLGGVFRNNFSQLGNNAFITFLPEDTFNWSPGLSNMEELFEDLVAELDTARTANPDLIALMQQLGFDTAHAIHSDFRRDLSGQTLTIVEDPEVINALYRGSSPLFGSFVNDSSEIKGLYVDTTDATSSMFNFPYHLQLAEEDLFYDLLLNARFQAEMLGLSIDSDCTTLFPVPNILKQAGNISQEQPTINVSAVIAADDFTDFQIYERFGDAKANYDFLIGIPLFARLEASYDEQGATFSGVYNALVTDASHVYNFDEVSLAVALETLAVKIVYGLEWRENLQAILLSLGRVNDLQIGQKK